ncbi:MAG TPA: FCD domain-containing protein [Paracoccaceae bacterium]|nr:FCD domain-containing protein [Paracoccaceae bacterium]
MKHVSDDITIGETTYNALRRDIIHCHLQPGEKLKLDDLKTRYNASVSTLREVLNRLTAEHFVATSGQRGFFVAPMSDTDMQEVGDLRILLEGHALQLSFAAGDTEWEGRVVAAHHKLHRMEERMESEDYSVKEVWKQYDWEFHQSLIMACGSNALLQVHGVIFDRYLRYQMRALTYRGEIAAREHRQLLECALSRDAESAQVVLRKHIEAGIQHSIAARTS